MLLFFWRSPGGPAPPTTYLDLWDLIHSWIETHPIEGLIGGLWSENAPRGTAFPYAVERSRATETTHLVGPEEGSVHEIHFSVFVRDRSEIADFADRFKVAFADFWPTLKSQNFTDGTVGDRWEFGREAHRKDPNRGPNGEQIWILDLFFEAETSKSL